MKTAFVFPGQGSQFPGMGKDVYDADDQAKQLFHLANRVLGFDIVSVMFEGTEEELKKTSITQPAIFLHSMASSYSSEYNKIVPDAVAGHSLGEFSALVVANVLSFEDGLKLVRIRAEAMQQACNEQASTMAAVLGLTDEQVDEACRSVSDEIVVAANYNTVGQVVISGTIKGIEQASQRLTELGAKRVIRLHVNGAFHSPLMQSARRELEKEIRKLTFSEPKMPIYQNAIAKAVYNTNDIKENLIKQLTAPVLWSQSIRQMKVDGIEQFVEVGPGKVLTGLIRKIR